MAWIVAVRDENRAIFECTVLSTRDGKSMVVPTDFIQRCWERIDDSENA